MSDVDFAFEEAFNVLCGERLGGGIAREVFECAFDPKLVVKVEREDRSFQNIMEWKFWEECRYWDKAARWLAPCVRISPRGTVLLQKRVEPAQYGQLPAKLPAFLVRDEKPEHFGFYEGRLVCCDYALADSTLPMNLKKADWD